LILDTYYYASGKSIKDTATIEPWLRPSLEVAKKYLNFDSSSLSITSTIIACGIMESKQGSSISGLSEYGPGYDPTLTTTNPLVIKPILNQTDYFHAWFLTEEGYLYSRAFNISDVESAVCQAKDVYTANQYCRLVWLPKKED
jgi:hypothetical protein